MTIGEINAVQRRLAPLPVVPRSRSDFRRIARWWELEALRGYPSSAASRSYAANMRWLVELLDNGHKVIGRPFSDISREHGRQRSP